MSQPHFALGVPLMDEDHAHLEALLAGVGAVPDTGLYAFLELCRSEIAAHFGREEELMRSAVVPVLHCHIAQHNRLIEDIDFMLANGRGLSADALRTYLSRDVANLLMSHIASVDQISARFLRGDLDAEMVGRLRLPLEDAP